MTPALISLILFLIKLAPFIWHSCGAQTNIVWYPTLTPKMNIMTRPHSVLLISAFQDENNKLFGQLRLETNHTYLYSISYEAQDRHRRREKEGREGGGEGRELEQLHASARNNLRPGDSLSSALASNWMITPPSPSRLELIRNPTVCAPPLPDPSSLLLI